MLKVKKKHASSKKNILIVQNTLKTLNTKKLMDFDG